MFQGTKPLLSVLMLALLSSTASPTHAEELDAIFKKVTEYVAQENYTKAIEELSWAKKELEKLNNGKIAKLFPDELVGFKGQKIENSSALGFTNIERKYTNGKDTIQVSLTGGSAEGMGGLAGLARMGMMMGVNSPGSETIRIDGRTAMLDTSSGNPNLTIALDSGQILKVEGQNNVSAETVKSFTESLKVGDLDNYLKGSK